MSRKKVLLVDDVRLLLELEKTFLKNLPVDVIVASNGADALSMVHSERPDLIYMDLNMPVMDGSTCCATLKSDPVTKNIPIIMVTTAGKEEDELLCRKAGCDEFITKPINRNEFLDKGRKCLIDFERRTRRIPYSGQIKYINNGEEATGAITDISRGGLFVAAGHDVLPDASIDFSFTIHLPEEKLVVGSKGRVAWQNMPPNPRKPDYPQGFGMEFTKIDPKIISLIDEFFFSTLLKS